ncbi:alanine dehydrogenase [Anaerovoracaceae bacterium 41-7]|nr:MULTISPECIES: alanine dehydrogenase [Anaerotruncus]MCI9640574.1 alanine dehydrogenase [Emergencia sp.]
MIISVIKEIKPYENRVAATPTTVGELVRRGHEVLVERGAGLGSHFTDGEYEAAGAKIVAKEEAWNKGELIYKVKEIFPEEYQYINDKKIIFTYIHSNAHLDQTQYLLASGCTSIAYEDVIASDGTFPLLAPMSELAGKGGFLAALHFSQSVHGGQGVLLNNVSGVESPVVTIIGAGVSGMGAAELAAAFGNRVQILEVNSKIIENARNRLPYNVELLYSNRANLERCLKNSDVIINCILWDKTRKDHLIYREDLKLMKSGALIVDVACDDNGAIETCRSTSHADPIYVEEGITHYAVDNIPSAFAKTASVTLSNATLAYVIEIAQKGVERALKENAGLRRGLTTYKGQLTLLETAEKYGIEFINPNELVETF